MYKTLSRHLQHGDGKERSLSPETKLYEKRKNDKRCTIGSAHKGKVIVGKVTKIVDYGAFIDVNGVSGFVHISELSNKRVTDINRELTVGILYEFKILEIGLNKKGNLSFKLTKKLDSEQYSATDRKNKTVSEQSQKIYSSNVSISSKASSEKHIGFTIGEILNAKRQQNIVKESDNNSSNQIEVKDFEVNQIFNPSTNESIIDEYEDIKI